MHDAVVVGAGPAGAMAARVLARNGFDVQVVEKKRIVGEPVQCAEGMSGYALQLNGLSVDRSWVMADVKGVIGVAPSGGTFYVTKDPGYSIDRAAFDRWLLQGALNQGAELALDTRIRAVRRKDDCWAAEAADGRTFEGTILIGADGPASSIATWLGMVTEREFVEAYQYKFRAEDVPLDDPDYFYLYLGEQYNGGYAWVFPRGEECNVGVGGHIPASLMLKRFCDQMGFDVKRRRSVNAGIIPRRYGLTAYSWGGVAIVGDAAGTTNPLNGGGIHPALFSGRAAGEAAVRALEAEDVSMLSEYDTVLRASPYMDPILWRTSRWAEVWDDDLFNFVAEFLEGGSAAEPPFFHGFLTLLRHPRYAIWARRFLMMKKAVDISVVYGW